MGHTSTNLLVHFIFGTKQRAPLITPEIESDLHAYIGGIIREIGGVALAINGIPDHVHILARVPAKHSVAELACLAKTNSSRWVHERWPERRDFAWQTGYGAFSVSESAAGAVKSYISNQRKHHQKASFQEEFLGFLRKNNIAFDERYLWD
ncbi:MAG: IS200/IS605 family transposase [Terriglobales bacterium]